MSRLEMIRALAELRADEQRETETLVSLPVETDNHPTIPDPPGWSGPCAERYRHWIDEAGRTYYAAPGAIAYTDGV